MPRAAGARFPLGAIVLGGLVTWAFAGRLLKPSADSPPLPFDPQGTFELELGRGDRRGLNIVRIAEDGQATLLRRGGPPPCWEQATMRLSPDRIRRIGAAAATHLTLDQRSAPRRTLGNGTQWILRLRQGLQQKSIFGDDNLSAPLVRFAAVLDGELAAAGARRVLWSRVSDATAEARQAALRNAVAPPFLPGPR